jgi:hypothetical protein
MPTLCIIYIINSSQHSSEEGSAIVPICQLRKQRARRWYTFLTEVIIGEQGFELGGFHFRELSFYHTGQGG